MPNLPYSVFSGGTAWGSLTPYGQFALVVADIAHQPGGFAGPGQGAFLERCGTHMRRMLTSGESVPVSNGGAIVWPTAGDRLNGLLLPSLQSFAIPLPPAVVASQTGAYGHEFQLALSSRALYLRAFGGTLWQTASPAALPRNMSAPRITQSGSTLTCQHGSWRNARTFSYAWRVNRTLEKAVKFRLALGTGRKPRRVSCSVTASNAKGTTTASSAELHVR